MGERVDEMRDSFNEQFKDQSGKTPEDHFRVRRGGGEGGGSGQGVRELEGWQRN